MKAWLLSLVLVITAGAVFAQEAYTDEEIAEIAKDAGMAPDPLMVEGDIDYGEYLSGEWTTCHQLDGNFDGIPAITQWDALFFKLAMHEYKMKSRENPVMQMIAGRLNDEEIASLAAYFAQIEQ